MKRTWIWMSWCLAGLILAGVPARAQQLAPETPARRLTVTGMAAGVDDKARDQAIQDALRQAVEQGTGVFLTRQSKTKNYQTLYDKIFADAVGYIKEHSVEKVWTAEGVTFAKVNAVVSTQQFQRDWAAIAHTYEQQNNPRVILVIGETTFEMLKQAEVVAQADAARISAVRTSAARVAAAQQSSTSVQTSDVYAEQGDFDRNDVPDPDNYQTAGRVDTNQQAGQAAAAEASAAEATRVDAAAYQAGLAVYERVATEMAEHGTVQTRLEDFFLDKGIVLVDKTQSETVNKRDLMLASAKEDLSGVAALGARYNADVILLGTAAARPGEKVTLAGKDFYKYDARMTVRAIRTDSAQLIVSKVYTATANSTRATGGESKALDKLAEDAAPQLLASIVEAWRRQVDVKRNIKLFVSGMDYEEYKAFKDATDRMKGLRGLRLRGIVEGLAEIDVEYEFSTELFADHITDLSTPALRITEITPNKIKAEITPPAPAAPTDAAASQPTE